MECKVSGRSSFNLTLSHLISSKIFSIILIHSGSIIPRIPIHLFQDYVLSHEREPGMWQSGPKWGVGCTFPDTPPGLLLDSDQRKGLDTLLHSLPVPGSITTTSANGPIPHSLNHKNNITIVRSSPSPSPTGQASPSPGLENRNTSLLSPIQGKII